MPDITITVPEEWAEVVGDDSVEWAKLDVLRDAVGKSADRITMSSECNWQDTVGEPIPRVVRELERLQSLIEAVRELAGEQEAAQAARLSAVVD